MSRFSLRPPSLVAAVVALTAGCEFPTDAPIIQQEWMIPAEEISISVAEVLPDEVTIVGSNFSVEVDPFSVSETLGDVCGLPCIVLDGTQDAPVPAFDATFSVGESLPTDVAEVAIANGSGISLEIDNQLGFDPIEGGGIVSITLRDGPGGTILGTVEWNGAAPANESLASGMTHTKVLPIAPGDLSGFDIEVEITSVGNQTADIDQNAEFTVTATPTVLVSSVTLSIPSAAVDFDPVELDVSEIDTDIADKVVQGGIIFEIQNPLGVAVTADLVITQGGVPVVTKPFNVTAAATSSPSISLTGDEFRSFMGQDDVFFTGSGTATAGSVTVTPTMEIIMTPTLDLTVEVGG